VNTRPGSIRSLVAVGVSATLVLAACGGDDDDDATSDTTSGITSDTTGAPAEEPAESSAEAGAVGEDVAAAPDAGAEEAAGGDVITIASFAFGGATEVAVGTTVTVVNEDGSDHTWTADDGTFSSGNLAPGDRFEFTFDEPGTYTYACRIHPTMVGTITVTG
jgi:plastocyanin